MTPDKPAMTFLGETRTWKQIDDRSHAFGAALSRRGGVRFGDRVLMALLNRTEYVEAILGATLIGAIPVPVNIRMSPAEVAYLMEDSGADVVVTETALTGVVDAARGLGGTSDTVIVVGESDKPDHLSFEDLVAEDGSDLPLVDVPRGHCGDHHVHLGHHRPSQGRDAHPSELPGAGPDLDLHDESAGRDVASIVPPMFHIAGLATFAMVFYRGIRAVIHPLGSFDPDVMLDTLEREARRRCSWCPHNGRPCAPHRRPSPPGICDCVT